MTKQVEQSPGQAGQCGRAERQPELVRIVESPEFRRALRAIAKAPIRYEDFERMPVPRGYTHHDIWSILITIQREFGHETAVRPWFKNVDKNEGWYFIPESVLDDLDNLASIAGEESHLNRNARSATKVDEYLLAGVWEEVASLARRDGLAISERTVRDIWLGSREPAGAAEQIVANLARAFDDCGRLMRANRFSRVVIMELHDMLVQGLGTVDLTPHLYFDTALSEPNRLSDADYIAESIDGIIEKSRAASNLQQIIIQAVENSLVFWDLPYVPTLRCLTEFLVRRAYFIAHDLPCYSYFPFSAKVDQIGRPYLQEHEAEYTAFAQEGLNSTWIYAGGVRAYLECARELAEAVERFEGSLKDERARIEAMGDLNARQKSFALVALKAPSRRFKISDYIKMHDVAYATAHSDLMGLVNRGILSMQRQGKAFAFQYAQN